MNHDKINKEKVITISLIASFLSMFLGILIYVFLRPTEARAVSSLLEVIPILNDLRQITISYNYPPWVLYNLPDFLWAYSFTLVVLSIWGFEYSKESIFWLSSIPLLTLGYEFSQYFGILPGTFDLMDVIFTVFAIIAGFITIKFLKGVCLNE